MSETFVTTIIKGANKNTTGIIVPPGVVSALGVSKKPAVRVTLNGYTYRSTIAPMGGQFAIPDDLRAALETSGALDAFEKAAPSRRKEFVRQVEEAKAADTRERRISKIVASCKALQSVGGGQ